jgi:hypothetical protein
MACRGLGFVDYDVTLSGVCTNPGSLNIYIDEAISGTPATGDTLFQLSDCTDPAPDGYYILDSGNPNDVFVVTGGTGVIASLDSCTAFNCRNIISVEHSFISVLDACSNPLVDGFSISEASFGNPQLGDILYIGSDCITPAPDGFYVLDPLQPNNIYIVTGGNGEITDIDSCTNECPLITFDISITGETYCIPNNGAASVSNITGGTGPYTYTWSNSLFTGDTLTGLSSNNYSVTVTDVSGCTQTETFFIPLSNEIVVTNITTTLSDCFSCNGQATINFSGGELPYTIIGSNGQTGTTSSNSFIFTGLCEGSLIYQITDSRGCSLSDSVVISSTAGFTLVSITSTNSSCSQGGSVSVEISAPAGLFTYTLTAQTTSNVTTIVTSSQNYTFTGLSSGVYDVGILGNDTECFYTQTVTIVNEDSFSLDLTITESFCNINGGSVIVNIIPTGDTPSYPVDYVLTNLTTSNVVFNSLNTVLSSQTITNLSSANYNISVTDNNGCQSTQNFSISNSPGITMLLNKTDCILGNDGKIFVYINSGTAPFTLNWSPSVPLVNPNPFGQVGLYLDNLSGGTYTLTVTDVSGCTATQSVVIDCSSQTVNCYELFEICDSDFDTTVGNKRSLESMLYETFNDITSGQTNCILTGSVFTTNLIITGSTIYSALTDSFYTGFTLNDVPTDEQWVESIEFLLNQLLDDDIISDYTIDLENNRLSISSNCNLEPDPLSDALFNLSLDINIGVNCVEPSPTPSVTPTNTVTPSVTPTNSMTPTVTPTSSGPAPTPTVTPTSSGPAPTPTVTPTSSGPAPTPSPTPVPPCSPCTSYEIRNTQESETSVSYTDCTTQETEFITLTANQTLSICSCDEPVSVPPGRIEILSESPCEPG